MGKEGGKPTLLWELLAFLLLGQLLILPVFAQGAFVSHDLLSHWNWSRHFTEQFWSGEFYPRWLAGMNGGRGSPVFFFYGPVAFWFTALLAPLTGPGANGWLALGLSFGLAAGVSGGTAFLWLRDLVGREKAFWGAFLYVSLPYHIPVEVFYRFGLAEMWALAWAPLVLWSFRRTMLAGESPTWLALSYALLIMTHPPSTLLVSLLLVPYGLILAAGMEDFPTGCLRFGTGLAWGVLLSAVYLLPILEIGDWVSLERLQTGIGSFSSNFLGQTVQLEGTGFATYLEHITLYAGILVLLGLLLGSRACSRSRLEIRFWSLAAVLSIFLMHPVSAGLWNTVPLLPLLQFPWRFHVILALAVTITFSAALEAVERRIARTLAVLVCLCNLLMVLAAAIPYFEHRPMERDLQIMRSSLHNREGAPEYLPRWTPRILVEKVYGRDLPALTEEFRLVSGSGAIEIERESSRSLRLHVSTGERLKIELGEFYFPLWQVESGEDPGPAISGPSEAGRLLLDLPPGRYQAELVLGTSHGERAGWVLSAVALAMIPVVQWGRRKN